MIAFQYVENVDICKTFVYASTKIRPKQMNENKKIGMRIMVGALTHLLYCVYPVLEKQSYD
jgi:hypothetical protein